MARQEEVREIIDEVATGEIKPTKALYLLSELGVVIRERIGEDIQGTAEYIVESLIKE